MQTERDYWLAFSGFSGIGPKRFKLLLSYFGAAKKAWEARDGLWRKLGLGEKLTQRFLVYRQVFNFEKLKDALIKQSINIITLQDDDYPTLLKQSEDAPFLLYIKGKILSQDGKAMAIVGTRKVTTYGREVTEKFATQLVAHGFTVVSGLARGVDGIAHRAVLSVGGRAIAVLGSGLDRVYPVEHTTLARQIIESGGALISEYPPGMAAIPGNFPARNRIVAGLCLGVLITEGAARSGTKITACAAINQGKEVFAVPGPITSPMSQAPADLIKMGAKLVTNISDILEELPVSSSSVADNNSSTSGKKSVEFSTKEERAIWEVLLSGAKQIDDIVRITNLPTSKVTSTLTLLEVSGKVKNIGDGRYMVI